MIDKHPSRDASKPNAVKMPVTSTTSKTVDKVLHKGSGQEGVQYGFRHELKGLDPNRSEMKHHFEDYVGIEKTMKDGGVSFGIASIAAARPSRRQSPLPKRSKKVPPRSTAHGSQVLVASKSHGTHAQR